MEKKPTYYPAVPALPLSFPGDTDTVVLAALGEGWALANAKQNVKGKVFSAPFYSIALGSCFSGRVLGEYHCR